MALIFNPNTGQYEWDYSNGAPPTNQAPWDPSTGQPLPPPPSGAPPPPPTGGGANAPTAPGVTRGPDNAGRADGDPNYGLPPDPAATPPPSAPPPATTNTGGGTSMVGAPWGRPVGGISDWGPQFTAPQMQAPQPFSYGDFKTSTPFTPGQFSFGDFQTKPFTPPTATDAAQEPGYAFAAQQGQQALENSKAAEGVYRSGGTLKDIYGWGNKFAEQNYGNVFNRALTTQQSNENQAFNAWQGNRANEFGNFQANNTNALDAWKANEGAQFSAWQGNRNNAASNYATNYGVARDVFDRNYQGALDQFAPKQDYARLDMARQWSDYLAKLDATKFLADPVKQN